MTDAKRRLRRVLGRVPGLLALARLVVATIRICMRYRVTGLASEAGFFALLSLPPLILGLVGGLAYVANAIGPVRVDAVITAVNNYASQFLTEDVIKDTLLPTIEDVATGPRFDLLSLGFVLSLWSGSRALNVFVDTISIMYGQSGVRGIVRTRALSFSLYLLALALGIVTIPLVLLGPSLLGEMLPEGWTWLSTPVLAAGHPAVGRRPDQPVPRVDAEAVALAARRSPGPCSPWSCGSSPRSSCAARSPRPSAGARRSTGRCRRRSSC